MNLAQGVQVVSLGLLSLMVLGAALGVVLANNIVYSAFLLGGVFISISGLYILLNAGFVATAQILIYVGAVNVLILFAIMLVNKREDFTPISSAWIRKGVTGLVCIGLFALLSTMVLTTPWLISSIPASGEQATLLIGEHLFSDFLLPFELASVLLLIALIGAIILARRELIVNEPSSGVEAGLMLPERPREGVAVGSDR